MSQSRRLAVFATALMAVLLVAGACSGAVIAIFKTESGTMAYDDPAPPFKDAVTEALGAVEFVEYDMKGDMQGLGMEIIETLKRTRPDLILTLGSRASYLVARNIHDIPAVFASVVNWSKFDLKTASMTGIALEVPEPVLLSQFKTLVADLVTVGMLYKPETADQLVQRARRSAPDFGLSIKAEIIRGQQDVIPAFDRIAPQINGFWMHIDSDLAAVFAELSSAAINRRIPLMTPSAQFVEAGGLTSISWSYYNIGAQAGATAVQILRDGDSPRDIPVADPIGTEFIVNLNTARAIGLEIDAFVLATFVDRVIGAPGP